LRHGRAEQGSIGGRAAQTNNWIEGTRYVDHHPNGLLQHRLNRMQGDPAYEVKHKPAPKAVAFSVPKADTYGGVVFDAIGRTLLREPAGHFGGYVWTFAKGGPDAGETPQQTALREVLEETGYSCRITGAIPIAFAGTTSTAAFFLTETLGDQGAFSNETAQTCWADPTEARRLIKLSKSAKGVKRDLAVLDAAIVALEAGGRPS
jgi:8-oxo-dGTP diphosphatase